LFDDKNILITGGSGSLGQALTRKLLEYNFKTLRIFSRNESKQVEMQKKFDDPRLRFLIGDVRDQPRLSRALEDVDYVFHAAALKHVPVIEYNPREAILTNIIGSQNVVIESIRNGVEKVIGISTDKAVSPLNTYGATKLLMEKLFLSSINQFNQEKYLTIISCIRYGNVAASSGSVIPLFINQIKNKQKITITDPRMTRFNILMEDAVDFILSSSEMASGYEVFVPKMKAYNIMDLKDTLTDMLGNCEHEIIKIRPGEKLHELLINKSEITYTKDIEDRFVIIYPHLLENPTSHMRKLATKYGNMKDVSFEDEYSSDKVPLLSKAELKDLLQRFV